MKGFKGTPGPWVAVQQYVDEVSVIDADGFKVVTAERTAVLIDWDKKGLEHWGDDGGSRHLSGPEQFANAHLIASAPRLLEVAISLLEALESENPKAYSDIIDEARAEIAKALGESK